MNLQDVAVRVNKGATVAELQPVDVVETVTPPTKEERKRECISELIHGTDYRLSAADKEKLSGLLKEFSDTLSVDEYDMGQTGVIEHHIDTGQHPPIRQALHRHPSPHLQSIHEQTELMMKQKIIEPSVSGWTSNVVLVRKGNTLAADLKLKPFKSRLFHKRAGFLGHIVSKDGIETDPEKIEAVATWPVPECARDLRSVIGLCSYYRRFVRGFAKVADPHHALTSKYARFE